MMYFNSIYYIIRLKNHHNVSMHLTIQNQAKYVKK